MNRIDQHLTDQASPRLDPGWFHPSSLGPSRCNVALALEFLGVASDRSLPANVQRIFELGHARDLAWKSYLAETGLSVCRSDEDRKICLPQLRIRGECDDIINGPGGVPHIVEIKTMRESVWKDAKEPLPDHWVQGHVYMAGHRIWKTLYIYENKSDCQVKTFVINFDPLTWIQIQQRVKDLLDQLKNGYIPDAGCKYGCAFPGHCTRFDFRAAAEQVKELLHEDV